MKISGHLMYTAPA